MQPKGVNLEAAGLRFEECRGHTPPGVSRYVCFLSGLETGRRKILPNQTTPTDTNNEYEYRTNHPDAAPKKPASNCCLSSSTLPTTIVSRVPARQVRSGIITEGCKKGYPRGHNSSACEDGNDRAPWTMFQLHGSCRIHPSRSSLAFPLLRDTSDVLGSTAKHLDHAPSPRRCS